MTLLQQIVGTKDISFLITLKAAELNQFYLNIATNEKINILSKLGRMIGAFGALFYISFRVWKHMANNEPINVFPLLRPLFIGFCLSIFPSIISLINALLHPMITVTEAMVGDSNISVQSCNDRTNWWGFPQDLFCYIYQYPIAHLLMLVGQAVALGLNILRLFYLIVLSILGPIAFSLAIFDGFEGNIIGWLKKYVVIYMWLPVLNLLQMCINQILGRFLENASASQLLSVSLITDSGFGTTVIILIISIYTYTKVPAMTSWIVEAGSPGTFEQAAGATAAGYVGGTLSAMKQGGMKVLAAKTRGASMAAQKVGSAISSAAKKN